LRDLVSRRAGRPKRAGVVLMRALLAGGDVTTPEPVPECPREPV